MPDRKGFTLVEMLVVLIILAILAALSIPAFLAYTQQAGANAAQNKLISIYKGELTYYLNNNSYCRNTGPPPHLCGDLVSINTNLLLNIIDTDFTYVCNQGGGPANGFQCTATATSIAGFTLTLTNNPVVLLGGTGCATTSGASCNPVCAPAASIYCPT